MDLDSTSNDSPALAPIAEDNAEEVTIPPPVTSPLADILDKLLQPIRGRKGRRKVAPIAEEVPTSKEATAPLADGPSAKAPIETSKPASRKQLGRRGISACLRPLFALAVLVLSMLCCFTMASMAFFTSYALLHESLRSAMLPPVAASSVLQELVETGATLYDGNWSGCTQKQMADLGIQENYTQGLDYVDCEVEAAFCRLRNVTSYPTTWEINGQLYPECYSLQELSDKFLGDDDYYSPCAFTWEDPASIFSYSGHGTCNFEIGMFFSRALMFTVWIVMWLRILPVITKLYPKRTFCFCVPVTFLLLPPPYCAAKNVGRFARLALAATAFAFAAFATSNPGGALCALWGLVCLVLIYAHPRNSASIDQVKTVSAT